uniref:ATP synthase complex subunit 8 n=1 Tax=Gryllotalpa orientalis TaxID=213494 RepID=Q5ISF3_GRYOR|nr:ATP synthase F0 subunit 8 [Gryllotalpa orientalis]AAT64922.1 ATP synthase F0 subunit 8 [Gryllotalpa orientalis]
MPQMAPMWWTTLLSFFCMVMSIVICLNFSIQSPQIINQSCVISKKLYNWKW